MRPTWYIALKKFGPFSGPAWDEYAAWARLTQLEEVVSLDTILCPSEIWELSREDWLHNVQEDFMIEFFWDLDYLLGRLESVQGINVLAAQREPDAASVAAFQDGRFAFQGLDLVERPGLGVSALVNCGGFEKAFRPDDLNSVGLLPDYDLARAVQQRLRENYPGERHADCCVWALWKMI